MITVAIAEDHQSLIDGIELLIKYDENFSIIGIANDGEALIDIVDKEQPQVILTDIKMPKIDGIAATKIIKKKYPGIKVIAFSMFDQDEAISNMIKAGASGYLLKNSPLEQLLLAIKTVHAGGTYFDSSINLSLITEGSVTSAKKSILSKSETEILKLIGYGKASSEIAATRFTSVSTVEKHRKNMIRKLGLKGKGELLRYALEKKYDFE
ncbi:oxygen regulatory protein NreC [Patiriisocius marinistellae]|uniref:Oxygen regulatory protein NreC n=1 Tax=Patiriisocius marinistellae TaxID=2494560 RepID=A0A5J4G0C9_9FLAO|nr:response regulator transcription factor [Patiriisocius marinistellae]GEQ85755.1 oxygen regulatory protein NreC [Patiriisocius marinistellae]